MATRSNAQQLSDESVEKATGASRGHWFALLDSEGANGWPHTAIAAHLVEHHGMDGWWAQGVTIAYEQARGLRVPGQRADGTFEAGVTKQVRAPLDAVYAALVDPVLRFGWLDSALAAMHPGIRLEVVGETAGKSVRWRWFDDAEDDGRRVVATVSRAGDAVRVAITHTGLPDSGRVPELKELWRERLAALAEQLSR